MFCLYCGKETQGKRQQCDSCSVSKRRWKRKLELISDKGGKCVLCGYDQHPAALQFHHLDRGDKKFNINSNKLLLKRVSIQEELDKCVILCANCHAIEHSCMEKYRISPPGFEPGMTN